eukprot:4921561-Prymnesium_polylepis.1
MCGVKLNHKLGAVPSGRGPHRIAHRRHVVDTFLLLPLKNSCKTLGASRAAPQVDGTSCALGLFPVLNDAG